MQISTQLASLSVSSSFIDTAQPSSSSTATSTPSSTAPVYAIWLNTLWFTALNSSLASATIRIIVKQWLKAYSTGLYGSSRDIARRRQHRLNELERWHVATIVALVPLLLLIAVVLFLAGLLILLYSIHPVVAAVSSVFAGLLLLFVAITTILPSIFCSCCYYSPQSHGMFLLSTGLMAAISSVGLQLAKSLHAICLWLAHQHQPALGQDRPVALHRIVAFTKWIQNTKENIPTWRGAEQDVLNQGSRLDVDMMVQAYISAQDAKFLEHAAVCLTDSRNHGLGFEYVTRIHVNLLSQHGPLERWPALVRQSFLSMVTYTVLGYLDQQKEDPLHAIVLPDDWEMRLCQSGMPYHDELVCMTALHSVNRRPDAEAADDMWNALYQSGAVLFTHNTNTQCTGPSF